MIAASNQIDNIVRGIGRSFNGTDAIVIGVVVLVLVVWILSRLAARHRP